MEQEQPAIELEQPSDFVDKIRLPKSPKLAELAQKAAQASAEYAALAGLHSLRGIEPEIGSVIQFEHTYARTGGYLSKAYMYIAIRTEAGWAVSGSRGGHAGLWAWDRLVEFIGDEECSIATAWAPLGGE